MRVVTSIAAGDGFSLEQIRVRAAAAAWSDPEVPVGYRLVLVRSGAFRARVGGHVLLADPAIAYVGGPGEEQSIAHQVGLEDTCTAVVFSERLVAELTGGEPVSPWVPVSGDVALAHRLLVSRARRCADPFELAEMTIRLVGGLLETRSPGRKAPGRVATAAARRRLVESARELLAQRPSTLGLPGIARHIGCSPHHLSRVFHEETGLTLTRYRNRLRVLAALEAIEAGEKDLAGLAIDLGFADHAHLTRTVRQECGHSPRALRRLLVTPN